MYLPVRRKKAKMNVRQVERRESARHRKFVRSFVCIAANSVDGCSGRIQCCHVRAGLPAGEQAGKAQKPHDAFSFPGCEYHHAVQHMIGESSFEKQYGVNLLAAAIKLAGLSPDPLIKQKVKDL
jgi:hypothetical protein